MRARMDRCGGSPKVRRGEWRRKPRKRPPPPRRPAAGRGRPLPQKAVAWGGVKQAPGIADSAAAKGVVPAGRQASWPAGRQADSRVCGHQVDARRPCQRSGAHWVARDAFWDQGPRPPARVTKRRRGAGSCPAGLAPNSARVCMLARSVGAASRGRHAAVLRHPHWSAAQHASP